MTQLGILMLCRLRSEAQWDPQVIRAILVSRAIVVIRAIQEHQATLAIPELVVTRRKY